MKQDNTLSFRGKALTFVLALATVFSTFGLIPDVSLTAYAQGSYASIKNTTTVVHFDGKDWYLIDYDDTTVTLLTKDSVGTSTFGSNNKYDGSTVKTFVNNWYNENITEAKKEAVSGGEMFLLDSQQVNKIAENVRKCNTSKGSWWTRSGGTSNTVLSVNGNDGFFDDYDGDYYCWQTLDVRPALKLNREKVDFISESKRFKLKGEGHYVAITSGNNMTKTSDSGDETQDDISAAIIDVKYNADEGYYFPEDYSIAEVSGVKVTRDSYTQITVSGTPTNDAFITLTDPTAKTTPAAPTTAVPNNCTKLDNNDGKLTGVTTAMEYKKSDDTDWIPGTGNEITGLESGKYYVRLKETDTTFPSENQELTIKKYVEYTVTFAVANGSWNDETDAAKTVTVEGYEGEELRLRNKDIPEVGSKPNTGYKAGSWNIEPTNTTAITEDTTYTYTYDSKGEQTIVAEDVTATYGDIDKKVTANVSDPTTGAGAISYAVKKGSEDYIDVDASNGSLTIKKVPANGKAYVIVTAAGTDDYREATKEVTVTIAHKITVEVQKTSIAGATVTGVADKVYTGKAITQNPTVKLGNTTLKNGTDYTLSYSANVNVGSNATVTINGIGKYTGSKSVKFKILSAAQAKNLSNAVVTGIVNKQFEGKAVTQNPTVTLGGVTLKNKTHYTISYSNNKKVGTATVTIKAKGKTYKGTKKVTFKITRGKNPLNATGKNTSIKASTLKNKSGSVAVSKIIKITKKGQGKLSYEMKSGDTRFKIDKKTGKVTVPKKAEKKPYKFTVRVTAAGTKDYLEGYKDVTFTITVK